MGYANDPIPNAAFDPPDAFYYAGVRCGRLSAAQYRLLQALTDPPQLRGFVPFVDIASHVWVDGPPPRNITAALKELGRRLDDKLVAAGVPLFLDRRDFAFQLTPFRTCSLTPFRTCA